LKYENRLPAEGINASHEHPLREFAWLAAVVLGLIAVAAGVVSYGAQWIAPRIPFEYEQRLVGDALSFAPRTQAGREVQAELQALADRLARRMDLPPGMTVKVGYRESGTINAFATLGGHAVFFRGLLAKVESEDALAMVMAHEMAHLKHRHPAAALGRGVAVGVILSLVSADLGRSAAAGVLSQAGVVTLLSFNRDQERQADEAALQVLAAEYGHLGGALELFSIFERAQAEQVGGTVPAIEFLATHPLTPNRVDAVRRWAAAHEKAVEGPRRLLTPALERLRAEVAAEPPDGAKSHAARP
jgi:predicted Zn-dependent protease